MIARWVTQDRHHLHAQFGVGALWHERLEQRGCRFEVARLQPGKPALDEHQDAAVGALSGPPERRRLGQEHALLAEAPPRRGPGRPPQRDIPAIPCLTEPGRYLREPADLGVQAWHVAGLGQRHEPQAAAGQRQARLGRRPGGPHDLCGVSGSPADVFGARARVTAGRQGGAAGRTVACPDGEADRRLAQLDPPRVLAGERQGHRQPGAQPRPQRRLAVPECPQRLFQQPALLLVEQRHLETRTRKTKRGVGQLDRPARPPGMLGRPE